VFVCARENTLRTAHEKFAHSRVVMAGEAFQENVPIRALVGSLQYIPTVTRPDISFAVQRVAKG